MKSVFLLLLFFSISIFGQSVFSTKIENFGELKRIELNPDSVAFHPLQLKQKIRSEPKKGAKSLYKLKQVTTYEKNPDYTKRYSYSYDINGNMLSELTQYFGNNTWWNWFKSSLTYDSSKKLASEYVYQWTNNAWVNYQRMMYSYDNWGNRIVWLVQDQINNTWVNRLKLTWTYDGNGNALTEVSQLWTNNSWINNHKHTYIYDGSGNMHTDVFQIWNSSWQNSIKDVYTYENTGNLLTKLEQMWVNNAWMDNSKDIYSYNNNGILDSMVTKLFAQNSQLWVNFTKNSYTYDNNGNLLTEVQDTSNLINSTNWLKDWKRSYTYDNNGNSVLSEYYQWGNSSWIYANGDFYFFYNNMHDSYYYYNCYKATAQYLNDINNWQLISWTPTSATEGDSIRVVFDASQGNQGLKGYLGDVYAHTGVLTNLSTGSSDWRYVKTSWGQNTPQTKLTRIGTDLYEYYIKPSSRVFYNVPIGEKILKVAFVFRSSVSPFLEGKTAEGGDIFLTLEAGTSVENDINVLPNEFFLFQNYPNPFNPNTVINYKLPKNEFVILKVYDILGNEVTTLVSKEQLAGSYEVVLEARNLTSGIYIYKITAGEFNASRKLILLK